MKLTAALRYLDQHTLAEWSDVQSALPATKMVLLLAVSLAGQGLTP